MAGEDKKVTDLGAASLPLSGTEILYAVQGGFDVQLTSQDIADLGGGAGANTTLSNLVSPTAINQTLLPEDGTPQIGSALLPWSAGYFANLSYDGTLNISLPNRTMSDSADKLSIDWNERALYGPAGTVVAEYATDDFRLADSGNRLGLYDTANGGYGYISISDGEIYQRSTYNTLFNFIFNTSHNMHLSAGVLTDERYVNLPDASATLAVSVNSVGADDAGNIILPLPSIDIQTFTSSGTWTKPAGAKRVTVYLRAGSGGAGSGRRGASASGRFGGGAGVAAALVQGIFNATILGATESVTVGAGGVGGAAVTVDDTNGNNGTAGGLSSFGTTVLLKSPASAAGSGGTAAAGSAGTAQTTQFGMFNNIQVTGGIGGSTTGGTAANRTDMTTPGSGGGAGIAAANGASAGGAGGGFTVNAVAPTTSGGAAGGSGGGNGGDTVLATYFYSIPIGTGAGGGGSRGASAGVGGNGGNGYTAGGIHTGAGGGGGAASLNGNNSGKGGDGSNGIIVVVTEF